MNASFLIAKKRDGGELTAEEIAWLVHGYVAGHVPDYQKAAWAMAVYLRGMTVAETAALTEAMLHSGATLTWPAGGLPKVDKHSTGGIGDKVSLVLAPLLACCGVQVPMISGRGLGATGGTLDKLESISGLRTDLSIDEMRRVLAEVGCFITGATHDLVPADRKLYALRDVTATVQSIPLITASIMSKKLAEGLDALVLDVKFGSGAFMKTLAEARQLAESLVATGNRMGVRTTALLTDMHQPLGRMAGNAIEVNESVAALEGRGPADLMEVTMALGAEVLVSSRVESSIETAREKLVSALDSGAGLKRLRQMVAATGGDLDAPRRVAPASEVSATRTGYIERINTEQLGGAIITLGGGRAKIGDAIDHSVGLEMLVRLGDKAEFGQPLVRLFAPPDKRETARELISEAIAIGDSPIVKQSLIVDRVY